MVLMVAVVWIQLGQCRDSGRQQAEQRQNGGSRAHRGNAANGSSLPCTLPLLESQVVIAPPLSPPLKIGDVATGFELFALLDSWKAFGGRTPAAPTAGLVAADR